MYTNELSVKCVTMINFLTVSTKSTNETTCVGINTVKCVKRMRDHKSILRFNFAKKSIEDCNIYFYYYMKNTWNSKKISIYKMKR